MRFLWILDRVENPASANALLACRLVAELMAEGHTVHLLELWDGQTPPPAAPDGAVQHTLAFADERLMNTALENGAKGGTPVPLRLLRLAAHPSAVAAAFRQLVLHAPRRTVDRGRAIVLLARESACAGFSRSAAHTGACCSQRYSLRFLRQPVPHGAGARLCPDLVHPTEPA